MATTVRRTDPSLIPALTEKPHGFGFFQAVRLMQLAITRFRPDDGTASLGRVRFHANNSLLFPASEIQALTLIGASFDVWINFLGITGPLGVLPSFYTQHLAEAGAKSVADFFDIFNNRLAWMFYRAWEKHRVFVGYELNLNSPGPPSPFKHHLLSLIGLGTEGLRSRNRLPKGSLPDEVYLYYAGILAQQPRSAVGLEGLLRDFFQVEVSVFPFEGAWVDLDQDNLSWLDEDLARNQLGFGAVAGDQVWNANARFRIRVGPLSLERYVSFLPGGIEYRRLIEISEFFADRRLDFTVQLVLAEREVPCARLDARLSEARLGYCTWLKTDCVWPRADRLADADDLVVHRPMEAGTS